MGLFNCLTSLITQTYLRIKNIATSGARRQDSTVVTTPESAQPTQESPTMDPRRLYVSDYYGDRNSLVRNGALPSRPFRPSSTHSSTPSSQRTSQTSRSDTDTKNVMSEKELRAKLREKLIEVHKGHWKSFVPKSDIKSLITVLVVLKAIQTGSERTGRDNDEIEEVATLVAKRAKRLFAVLARLRKSGDIYSFYRNNIMDDQLPLKLLKKNSKLSLRTKQGLPIPTCDSWDDETMEDFIRYQWSVSAPTFKMQPKGSPCLEFPEETVLPFIPLSDHERTTRAVPHKRIGGYSEVTAYRIHYAHHDFWETTTSAGKSHLIAVKTLISPDETEFIKEKSILDHLGPLNHPHLTKLLATYRMDGQYHLVFPCASSNLRTYWEDRKFPTFSEKRVLWSLKQMKGMASALSNIHIFRVTIDLSVDGGTRLVDDGKLAVKGGEEKYGRHGDIKPENILWFEQVLGQYVNDEMGVLQITDFGLGRFHGRESRSNIDPRKVQSPPTYEPPECQLGRDVSRAYDLWSLGCLYLEFVTWLLKGAEAIHTFADRRGKQAPNSIINDDSFFTIFPNQHSSENVAEVREDVIKWVKELHAAENCSQVMHEILDLVMDSLLQIDAGDRIPSCNLCNIMNAKLERAKKDKDYLLKAVPHAAPRKNVKAKEVRFAGTWPQSPR